MHSAAEEGYDKIVEVFLKLGYEVDMRAPAVSDTIFVRKYQYQY